MTNWFLLRSSQIRSKKDQKIGYSRRWDNEQPTRRRAPLHGPSTAHRAAATWTAPIVPTFIPGSTAASCRPLRIVRRLPVATQTFTGPNGARCNGVISAICKSAQQLAWEAQHFFGWPSNSHSQAASGGGGNFFQQALHGHGRWCFLSGHFVDFIFGGFFSYIPHFLSVPVLYRRLVFSFQAYTSRLVTHRHIPWIKNQILVFWAIRSLFEGKNACTLFILNELYLTLLGDWFVCIYNSILKF